MVSLEFFWPPVPGVNWLSLKLEVVSCVNCYTILVLGWFDTAGWTPANSTPNTIFCWFTSCSICNLVKIKDHGGFTTCRWQIGKCQTTLAPQVLFRQMFYSLKHFSNSCCIWPCYSNMTKSHIRFLLLQWQFLFVSF